MEQLSPCYSKMAQVKEHLIQCVSYRPFFNTGIRFYNKTNSSDIIQTQLPQTLALLIKCATYISPFETLYKETLKTKEITLFFGCPG